MKDAISPQPLAWHGAGGGTLEPATDPSASLAASALPRTLYLYAGVLSSRTLQAAANHLIGALVSDHALTRASIAWQRTGRLHLLTSSDLDRPPAHDEAAQAVLGAMEEATEQGLSLTWPSVQERTAGLPGPVSIEHQSLHRLTRCAVATIPLGQAGEGFGAVCLERDLSQPFHTSELRHLENVLALAAPALRWMQLGEERWSQRMRRDIREMWASLRQPDRRTTRRWLLAGALVVGFLAVAPLQREIGGRARVEGAQQRVLVAPADGFVKTAHVRPGDRVKAGDVLVDLLDGDLRLEHDRWASQLVQHENAYAAAMAKADRATASTSLARIAEAQSQLSLVEDRLARGRVEAPFDALVIQGDLSQAIGTPVRQGDTLLTLATTGRHRVLIEVDEIDIARVRSGQDGQLALSSLPWDRHDVVIERVVPLAKAVDGRNVFEVEARLIAASADMRPGLMGRADIVVGRSPLLWAWAARAVDRARVTWWTWLG